MPLLVWKPGELTRRYILCRQLKGAYALGRVGAQWRTTLLPIFAFIVMGLFSAVMVGVGAYG